MSSTLPIIGTKKETHAHDASYAQVVTVGACDMCLESNHGGKATPVDRVSI